MFDNDSRLDAFARHVLTKIIQYKSQQEQVNYIKRLLFLAPAHCPLSFAPELTKREVECLYYAAMGATSYETAQQLMLKTSTIIAHRKEALRKLGCRTLPQAVFKGVCCGLLPPEKIQE